MTILFAALAATITLALIRYVWQRPRFKAARKLRRLQAQSEDTRQQLFLIKRVLQEGLQVTQLQQVKCSSQLQTDWQQFCHELVHTCYRSTIPASDDVLRLTTQARSWLKRF